jgi:hypothetical protein
VKLRQISGSYGGEYEGDCLMGRWAVRSLVEIDRRFRGTFTMDAVNTSETSVNINQTTWRNTPENNQSSSLL